MKKNIVTFLLFGVVFLVSCSHDDEPTIKLSTPNTSGSLVKRVIHTGYTPECYDWELSYNNKQLTKGSASYRKEGPDNASFTYSLQLSYASKSVNISSVGSTITNVELEEHNFIRKMVINENTYTFNYQSSTGRLIQWSAEVRGTTLGSPILYTRSGTVTYDDNGDIKTVTYIDNSNYPDEVCSLSFTPDMSKYNVNGLLPEGVTKEIGVFGLEGLYYAGLLGKATTHLVKSVSISYANHTENNFTLDFDYVSDSEGDVTLCNYKYKDLSAIARYEY